MASAGEYGSDWEDMPFMLEVYGDLDMAMLRPGEEPAPTGIRKYLKGMQAAAAFTYVPGVGSKVVQVGPGLTALGFSAGNLNAINRFPIVR